MGNRSPEGVWLGAALGCVAAVTVTTMVSFIPEPSLAVAVMAAVPALTPVTTPFSTVATAASPVDQVTVLSAALSGVTAAVRVMVLPASTVVPPDRVTLVTSTGAGVGVGSVAPPSGS